MEQDLKDVIDYTLEHEGQDFEAQLLAGCIYPLSVKVDLYSEKTKEYESIRGSKESDTLFSWLAENGKDHIYCSAVRLYIKSRSTLDEVMKPQADNSKRLLAVDPNHFPPIRECIQNDQLTEAVDLINNMTEQAPFVNELLEPQAKSEPLEEPGTEEPETMDEFLDPKLERIEDELNRLVFNNGLSVGQGLINSVIKNIKEQIKLIHD